MVSVGRHRDTDIVEDLFVSRITDQRGRQHLRRFAITFLSHQQPPHREQQFRLEELFPNRLFQIQ